MTNNKTFCSKADGELIKGRKLNGGEIIIIDGKEIEAPLDMWLMKGEETGNVFVILSKALDNYYTSCEEIKEDEFDSQKENCQLDKKEPALSEEEMAKKKKEEEEKQKQEDQRFDNEVIGKIQDAISNKKYLICITNLVKDDDGNSSLFHTKFQKNISKEDAVNSIEKYKDLINE